MRLRSSSHAVVAKGRFKPTVDDSEILPVTTHIALSLESRHQKLLRFRNSDCAYDTLDSSSRTRGRLCSTSFSFRLLDMTEGLLTDYAKRTRSQTILVYLDQSSSSRTPLDICATVGDIYLQLCPELSRASVLHANVLRQNLRQSITGKKKSRLPVPPSTLIQNRKFPSMSKHASWRKSKPPLSGEEKPHLRTPRPNSIVSAKPGASWV
ncbi:hypothetical protein R3P38DRAFT_3296165, partial [Favolaschia claudopus]